MRMLLITCVAVAAGATTFAGQAAADPPPPNLDGYTAVEATAFETYSAYATSGVQFLTPDGLHCRITANSRATGVDGACWGKLPRRLGRREPRHGVADHLDRQPYPYARPGPAGNRRPARRITGRPRGHRPQHVSAALTGAEDHLRPQGHRQGDHLRRR